MLCFRFQINLLGSKIQIVCVYSKTKCSMHSVAIETCRRKLYPLTPFVFIRISLTNKHVKPTLIEKYNNTTTCTVLAKYEACF